MKKILTSFYICLVMIAMVNTTTFAAAPSDPVAPQANSYIFKTTVGIVPLGSGKIEVDFSVTGTGKLMPDIGATRVAIYKADGTRVAEYWHTDTGYGNMMGHNKFTHTANVTYQGVSGQSYYATVSFFAGTLGGSGGGHSMYTPIITA